MKAKLIEMIIGVLLSFLDEDLIREGFDLFFDFIEERIASTSTTYDDQLLLPIVSKLRDVLNIPDDD